MQIKHFHLRSSTNRAITIAYRRNLDVENIWEWAAAFCCRKDVFQKKRGASIARARLQKGRGRVHSTTLPALDNTRLGLVDALRSYARRHPEDVPSWTEDVCSAYESGK